MSARLTDAVWNSGLKAWLKPYAAVLAGFAHDDGTRVFPSIARVAWAVGVSERRAQGAVSKLTALGVLRIVQKHAPGRPTRYQFDVEALPRRAVFVAQQLTLTLKPDVHVTHNRTSASLKPDVCDVKPDVHVTRSVRRSVSTTKEHVPGEFKDPRWQPTLGPLDVSQGLQNKSPPTPDAQAQRLDAIEAIFRKAERDDQDRRRQRYARPFR